MRGKEPWGVMGPRFKVLITIGFVGSAWMFTEEPVAGAFLLAIFAALFYLRASESAVSEDPVQGLKQLDNRRGLMLFIVLLMLPVLWILGERSGAL